MGNRIALKMKLLLLLLSTATSSFTPCDYSKEIALICTPNQMKLQLSSAASASEECRGIFGDNGQYRVYVSPDHSYNHDTAVQPESSVCFVGNQYDLIASRHGTILYNSDCLTYDTDFRFYF